jgi:hypothetical protein
MTDISMVGPDGVMARYDTVPATEFAAPEGAR